MNIRRKRDLVSGLCVVLAIVTASYPPAVFAEDCIEINGRWAYGPANGIDVAGNLAFLGSGSFLKVLDVSNPSTPTVLGEVMISGVVGEITVSGEIAYVIDESTSALRVVDVSDPASPLEIGSSEGSERESVKGIAVSGNFAYLLVSGYPDSGFRVIDVNDPTSPVEVAFFEINGPSGISVSDSHAYVTTFSQGLQVIDINDPTSPAVVGDLEIGSAKVTVSGDFAYLAVTDSDDYPFHVIDISDPSSPSETGACEMQGNYFGNIAVSDGHAFVSTYNHGLRVIDISDTASPTEIGSLDDPGYARYVAVSGGFAFESFNSFPPSGLSVIDVTDPDSPVEVGSFETPLATTDVAVAGDLVFAVDGSFLRAIDISNATSPVEIGIIETPGYASRVAVAGGNAYTFGGPSIDVIDISDPERPVKIGAYDSPGNVQSVEVSGDHLFVAASGEGLRVIDVGDPTSPVEIGALDTPGYAVDVAVSGDHAFVADSESGLRIIDVSDPTSPIEVGFHDSSEDGEIRLCEVSADYVFVFDVIRGIDGYVTYFKVLDVSDPTTPVEIGSVWTGDAPRDLVLAGEFAYYVYWGGLVAIDISDPASPTRASTYPTPGSSAGVAFSGSHIVVADGDAGMEVFGECGAAPSPCTPIYIAAAASGPGAGASMWATDLGINNSGDAALAYRFRFLPRAADNTEVEFTEEFSLQPNTNAAFVDIWKQFTGGDGAGSINVCVSDPETAGVISRTYNTRDEGTFGQAIVGKRGMGTEKLIGTDERVRLGFLTQNSAFRTNVGFMNAGPNTITIDAEFFTADGTSLGDADLDLLPYSNFQWAKPFVNKVGANDVELGYIDVWSDTGDAAFLTYASVIDNETDDPTTIWPFETNQIIGGGAFECTPYWIAAAASSGGAGNTLWATDLGINNLGAEVLTYTFQFLPRGADNSDVAMSDPFTLGGGQAVAYSDIWSMTGGQGAGAINVCVDDADNAGIVSRIYNIGDDGTFGQVIEGLRGTAPAKVSTGERVRLGYLFENDAYRTNIGFMNAGAGEITVSVEFFDRDGTSLGTKDVTLGPYSNTQWNRPYTKEPIWRTDITAGFVDVWTDTPNADFLTYASIVDSGTGDPTTIWPF